MRESDRVQLIIDHEVGCTRYLVVNICAKKFVADVEYSANYAIICTSDIAKLFQIAFSALTLTNKP